MLLNNENNPPKVISAPDSDNGKNVNYIATVELNDGNSWQCHITIADNKDSKKFAEAHARANALATYPGYGIKEIILEKVTKFPDNK